MLFTIAVDDTAVQSGSFYYDVHYSYDPASNSFMSPATGDVQALQFFRAGLGGVSLTAGSPVSGFYSNYFTAVLNFNTQGQVTAGSVEYSTDSYYVFVRGNNQFFTGTSGTGSLPVANVSGPLSGSFPTAVPEPATLTFLSALLVEFYVQRRVRP